LPKVEKETRQQASLVTDNFVENLYIPKLVFLISNFLMLIVEAYKFIFTVIPTQGSKTSRLHYVQCKLAHSVYSRSSKVILALNQHCTTV